MFSPLFCHGRCGFANKLATALCFYLTSFKWLVLVSHVESWRSTDGLKVGHKIDLTSQWWSKAFNDAARSIKVDVSDGATIVTKAPKKKKKALPKHSYSGFIKAGVQDGNSWLQASPELVVQEPDTDEESPENVPDEELFKACGGLTAHKAARHGHKMSGKLKRVQEQEYGLLCALSSGGDKPSRKQPSEITDSCQVAELHDGSPEKLSTQQQQQPYRPKKKSHKYEKRKR
ncbi:G patch domain-containing protein 4-like isoform X1 [Dermacentor andersoni]|uniref:G patch domain-containing protein 4-like isoform X1 n=1 Tax=Dermacentor andersoni TaxID=34620 RepID=UPI002417B535|nr:G patch domain-containing protein 4-like isoform X1 [Dermacentor andersoni]